MSKIKKSILVSYILLLSLFGCGGTPPATTTGAGPDWIYNPSPVYPEDRYISAVGYGSDRESAEKNALGALASVFGQTVKGETMASYKYSEAVSGGLININEGSEIDNAVKTSFEMQTLVGAELKDRWFDGKDTHYAIAVMDRLQSSLLYSDLIESNLQVIDHLLDIPLNDRYSLDSYARYDLAAIIANANSTFMNVLSVLNPASAAGIRDETRREDTYRLEAFTIAQNIPIRVTVQNDRDGRIESAFSSVLSGRSFKTGEDDTRYMLNVAVTLSEVELPQNPNVFVRYIINADLRDTVNDITLFPYSVSGREGHTNLSEAENRALRVAEEKIKESYGAALDVYLTQLSSNKK
jgi:hypothetical protein